MNNMADARNVSVRFTLTAMNMGPFGILYEDALNTPTNFERNSVYMSIERSTQTARNSVDV